MADIDLFDIAAYGMLGIFVMGIIWVVFAIIIGGLELPLMQEIRNDTPLDARGLTDSQYNDLFDMVHGRMNWPFLGFMLLVFLFIAMGLAYKRDSQSQYQGGYQ